MLNNLLIHIKRIILFILFLSLQTNLKSQKLYIVGSSTDAEKTFIQKNQLDTYTIFYQQFFTTKGQLDKQKLSALLNKSFPNPKQSGFLVLDWEGEAIKELTSQKSSVLTEKYLNQFVDAIREVKKQRPKVKVGFYGLPYRQYWNFNDEYRIKNEKLSTILKEQDFLAPSLYVFYPEKSSQKNNDKYIESNIKMALKMGKELNKPVYPFIWQRIHNSNKKFGMSLMSPELFEATVSKILSVDYNGVKSAGVFWWHSELYNYRTKDKTQVLKQEYQNVKDFSAYQTEMFQKYYNTIHHLFN